MIVRKDKGYEINSLFPSSDWYDEGNYVVDETSEEGKLLAQKIIENAPYFDIVLDSEGNLIDIIPTERPEPQPVAPGPTIEERISALEDVLLMLL